MLTSFEAIPHSLSRQWIIGNRVVNSIKNQHRKLSRNLSHEENEEDRYRTCSDSSCRFFSRALLCIRVSILPNFVCTVRFRRRVCTCTYVAYRHRAWERSSIVLFHRARLVGGPKPRLSCIHWVYRIVSEIPGALKLALRNNSAVSKARAHSRAGCSLTLNAFIYFDCVHRVHPRITCAVRSSRALRLACAFYARGFVENGI